MIPPRKVTRERTEEAEAHVHRHAPRLDPDAGGTQNRRPRRSHLPRRHAEDPEAARRTDGCVGCIAMTTPRKPHALTATMETHCTDRGNADRFAAKYADQLRFCKATKTWYIWDE